MAHQRITDILTQNVTLDMIKAEFKYDIADLGEGLFALGRKSEAKIRAWAAEQEAKAATAEAPTTQAAPALPATAKQIGFMLSLIEDDRHEGCHLDIPTDPAVINRLSRRAASMYIDAMLNN